MKRTLYPFFACLVFVLFSFDAFADTTAPRPDLCVAYSTRAFPDLDAKDVQAAMQLYVRELGKEAGRRAEGYVYDSSNGLISEIRLGNYDLIALSSVTYLRIRDSVDTELALAHVKGGKISVRYLLVVGAQSPYQNLRDLRGKRINLLKGDDIGPLYLDTLLLQQRLPEARKFFASVEEKSKPSQLVLPIFFGQSDVCVITDTAFKNMAEMNPQVAKATRILASSDEMVGSITVFRKSVTKDIKRKSLDVAMSLKNSVRGRQILTLFKIEDLSPVKEPDLAGISKLIHDHDRLRGGR